MKPADSPEPKMCSNNQLLLKSDQLGVSSVCRKLDSRKIQPLQISKEHFMFPDEVPDDDDDKTPEYPLKEGHKLFIPQMSALNDQIQSSHLFSDVSTHLPTHPENGCEIFARSSGKEIEETSNPKSNKPYNTSRNSKHQIQQTNNPAPTHSGRFRRKCKKNILHDHSLGDIHNPRTETQNEEKFNKSTKTMFHDGNSEYSNRQCIQGPSQSLLQHEDDCVVSDHQYSVQEHTASPVCRVSEDINNNKNYGGENNIFTYDKQSFPDFQPENSEANNVSNIRVEDLDSNESSTDTTTRLPADENHAKDESHSSLPDVNLITSTDMSRSKNTNTSNLLLEGEHRVNCDPSNKNHLAKLHLEEIPENVLVSSLSIRENVSYESQSICDTEINCSDTDNGKSGLFQTSGFNNSSAPRNVSETPIDCKSKLFHSHKKDHCGTDTLVLHSEQIPEARSYKHCISGPYTNDKAEHVQDESGRQDHRTRIRRVNQIQVIDQSSTKPSNMVVLAQKDLHQIPKRFSSKLQSSQTCQPNTENSVALFALEQKNLCGCTTNVKNITPALRLTSGEEHFDSTALFESSQDLLLQFAQKQSKRIHNSKGEQIMFEQSKSSKIVSCHQRHPTVDYNGSKLHSDFRDSPTVSQAVEINPTTFLTTNFKDQAVSSYQTHTPVQETWKKSSPSFHFPTNKTCNNVQQTSQGHVTTETSLITRPHFDPPTIHPFAAKVNTRSANDFSMNVESHVSDTLQKSSCCNITSVPPLIHVSNRRSQLIPNNYSSQKYSQMCSESLNIFNHMHVNKVIQQNVEPTKRIKHPSWVRIHNIQSNTIRNPVTNSQMPDCNLTVVSQPERLPLYLQNEKSGHNRAYECTVHEHLHSKDSCTSIGEDYSSLIRGIPTKVCMPGSQSFISTRIPQGLQTNETSVGSDLPYEPLDLSRRPATDVNTTADMFTEHSICNNPLNTFTPLNVQEMPTAESDSCFVEPHSQSPIFRAYFKSAQHFQNNSTSRMLENQNEKSNTFPGSAPTKVQTFVATANRHQIQACDATFQQNIALEYRDSNHRMKSALKTQVTAPCEKNEHSLSYKPMLSSSGQNIQEHLPHAAVTLSIEAQDRISQASDVAKPCSSGFHSQAPNLPGRISSGGSHSLKVLPAIFSMSRITKHSNGNPDEHLSSPDAAASSCSNIQEQRGTTHSDDSAMSCSSRCSSSDSTVANFPSRVIPLPIKDFFTQSPKENTYSSLLMAKIASKSKKQMETNASCISQHHNDSSNFEIGNNLQKNLVIDLTEADDDCDVISVSSNDEDSRLDFFDATWRDRVSTPASLTTCTSVGELPLTHSNSTNIAAAGYSSEAEYLYATEKIHSNPANYHDCDRVSHSASGVCTEQPCLLSMNMEVSLDTERVQVQQEPNELREKNVLRGTSNGQTEVQPDNIQADSMQPHRLSHCMPSLFHSYDTENSVISHENKIIHNRIPSPTFNDIGTADKETSIKLLTATKSGQKLEELSSRIVMPSKYASEIQQFHTMNSEEVNQPNISTGLSSTHDNSTQRAAATLLELSKNPLYNNYKVVPETSEDYQEKVYQVHPTLEVNNTVEELLQEQICSGNSHRTPDTSEISHKSGARTSRRVGRPPKDWYSVSNSYSPETASVVSDSGIFASNNPSNSAPMINLSTSNIVSPSQACNTFHISGHTQYDLHKPIHQTHLVGTTSSLAPLTNSHLLVDNDLRTDHQMLPCDAISKMNNTCSPIATNTSAQHANIVPEQQCQIRVQKGVCLEKTLQTNSAVIEIHNNNPDTAIKVAVINTSIPCSNVDSSDANITFPENFQCQKANIRPLFDAHGKGSVGNISVNKYTTSTTNVVSTSACSVSSSATAASVLFSSVPSITPRFPPVGFISPVHPVLPGAGQRLLQPNMTSKAPGKNMSRLRSPLLKKMSTKAASPKLTRQHCKVNPQDKIFVIDGTCTEMPRETRRLLSDLRTPAPHKSQHVLPTGADSNPSNLMSASNQGLKTAKAGKKRKKTGRGKKKNTKKQKSFHQNVNVNLHELNQSKAVSGATLHDDKLAGPSHKYPDNNDQTAIIRNRRDSSNKRDFPSKSTACSLNMHHSTKSSSMPFRRDHSRMQNTINRSEISEDEFEKEQAVTSLLATMMHNKFNEPSH